jgi:hypothetical protein
MHTCAPPKGEHPKAQADWVCPACGAIWEAAEDVGIFDFDRSQAVTRAEWLLVEGPVIWRAS